MHRQELAICNKVLGDQHADTVTSMNSLALVLRYQGKYRESEATNQRALVGREEKLGKDHPDTLTSVYSLARLSELLHCYDEAMSLYRRACSGYQRRLGDSHPTTVACIDEFQDMLLTLDNLGRDETLCLVLSR